MDFQFTLKIPKKGNDMSIEQSLKEMQEKLMKKFNGVEISQELRDLHKMYKDRKEEADKCFNQNIAYHIHGLRQVVESFNKRSKANQILRNFESKFQHTQKNNDPECDCDDDEDDDE